MLLLSHFSCMIANCSKPCSNLFCQPFHVWVLGFSNMYCYNNQTLFTITTLIFYYMWMCEPTNWLLGVPLVDSKAVACDFCNVLAELDCLHCCVICCPQPLESVSRDVPPKTLESKTQTQISKTKMRLICLGFIPRQNWDPVIHRPWPPKPESRSREDAGIQDFVRRRQR